MERHKSFVYGEVRIIEGRDNPTIEVDVRPRASSRPICSVCGKKRVGYDRLGPWRFEFVPFWGMRGCPTMPFVGANTIDSPLRDSIESWAIVWSFERIPNCRTASMRAFFIYSVRRVKCPDCGIRVERVPWIDGKHRLMKTHAWFLASWAKRLSWSEVADAFRTSWHHVFLSVKMAVEWGREYMGLEGITASPYWAEVFLDQVVLSDDAIENRTDEKEGENAQATP